MQISWQIPEQYLHDQGFDTLFTEVDDSIIKLVQNKEYLRIECKE